MKKLYFVSTLALNMLVSVDNENNCRYLTETEQFPYMTGIDKEEQKTVATEFLNTVEDDSSWETDCSYEEIFTNDVEVIAEIEKDL